MKCSRPLNLSSSEKQRRESVTSLRRSGRSTSGKHWKYQTESADSSDNLNKIADDISDEVPVQFEVAADTSEPFPSSADPRRDKAEARRKPAETVVVLGAESPLLGKTRKKLDKVTRGKLYGKKEAEELVKQNLNKTILDRKYHCLQCDWTSSKLEAAREHVYNHFGVYLYQCQKCLDLFRKSAHLLRHLEIHKKREKQEKLQSGDKIGNYHLLKEPVYLPLKKAKPILRTYFSREPEGSSYDCSLCDFSSSCLISIRNHLLVNHLKLNIYKCQLCAQEFSLEADMKKHNLEKHGVSLESLEKVDDPDYESVETEVNVPPEDIANLPIEKLSGKKISSAQARVLRRTKIRRNAGMFECELCDFRRSTRSGVSDHVMSAHYDVFQYRCGQCSKMLRNWSRFTLHRATHLSTSTSTGTNSGGRKPFRPGTVELDRENDYHLLTEDIYVGREEGLRIAREYFYYQDTSRKYQCKLCHYQARHQNVEQHVLAVHLRHLHLYRCGQCGKMVRYSSKVFRDHLQLHVEGKVLCGLCQDLNQGGNKRFTKASLAAHIKRIHREGEYPCQHCSEVATTLAELRLHQRREHLVGIPASRLQFLCQLCQQTFPRRQQLEWHLESCQAGRSRSAFRKKISDCLTWRGGGVYSCNFCQKLFHPPRPTASSLPLARKHVVSIHQMNHLSKVKMTWTQGVEGLSSKKKAKTEPSLDVAEDDLIIEYFVSTEDINTKEVIIETSHSVV